jgi:peptide/nickel transport system substrate-binding protein
VEPTAPFYATLRSGQQQYQVSMDFNRQAVVNPILDIAKFLSADRAGNNYGEYEDRVVDDLHDRIMRETDPVDLKALLRQFERRVLDEQAHYLVTFWWHRIVPHDARLGGWTVSASHYLNQELAGVWLAPEQ